MRARIFFAGSLLAAVHACIACSNDKEGHSRFASGNCATPPCSVSTTVVGGSRGSQGGDAGVARDAAASPTGIACITDPTSQIRLCAATSLCPDFQLDVASFPGCGFIEASGQVDLECVCNGTQLCPIGTTCAGILSALKSGRTIADICNQVVNGNCRNLGGVPATGQGGAAGAAGASSMCDRGCAATCPPNTPSCVSSCGCAP
jgi:hypothetical protein